MHRKLVTLIMGSERTVSMTAGASAVSYVSRSEGSLENLIISGNANINEGGFGIYDSVSHRYGIKVRIHGKSFMGGDEFHSLLASSHAGYVTISVDENRRMSYSYNSLSSPVAIILPDMPSFKSDTRYTFRFHYLGTPESSTGLRVKYTDGSSEDILSGAAEECDIAFTSVEGKTVETLESSAELSDVARIDLDSFGIFEGEVDYNDFEPYHGEVYTVSTENPLAGIELSGKSAYDTFDWKSRCTTHRVTALEVENGRLYLENRSTRPIILRVALTNKIAVENPLVIFHDYDYKPTYDEIKGKAETYTVLNESGLALSTTTSTTISNYKRFFTTPRWLIYKRLENSSVYEGVNEKIPTIPAGYVGIEVWGNMMPSGVKAYYYT